jgi:hypothetical protein
MSKLEDSIREYVSSQRTKVLIPTQLHADIMRGVGSATRSRPRTSLSRQLAVSLALLVFAVSLGFGVTRLRATNQPSVPSLKRSQSPLQSPTSRPFPISGPSARFGSAMAYDAASGESILFGGQNADGSYLNDTWSWNGINWTELHPQTSPPPRVGAQAVYDGASNSIVLYGGKGRLSADTEGSFSDLWSWNGSNWVQLHSRHSPPARAGANLAYDSDMHTVVLFGGDGGSRVPIYMNDLWLWNGSDWVQEHPGNAPPGRSDASLVFDEASHRLVLFGGASGIPLSDTWTWSGQAWTALHPSTSPVGRYAAGATYDSLRGTVVIFGGEGGDINQGPVHSLADLWEWNGVTWLQLAGGGPPARSLASMSYDAARRVIVVFGGPSEAKAGAPLGDTWIWTGSAWIEELQH